MEVRKAHGQLLSKVLRTAECSEAVANGEFFQAKHLLALQQPCPHLQHPRLSYFSEFARHLRQQPLAATCCNKSMPQGSQRRSWQCEGPWRPAARPVAGLFSFPRAWSCTNILNKNPVAPHNVRMLSFQQRSRGCQTPVEASSCLCHAGPARSESSASCCTDSKASKQKHQEVRPKSC